MRKSRSCKGKTPKVSPSNIRSSVGIEALEKRLLLSGTWTALANRAQGQVGTMMLLPDGTVLAPTDGAGPGSDWARLTPSATGSYVNGTWTKLANANDTRLYDTSVVLQNGSVFVAGGEYGTGGSTAEIYNPLTNTWTRTPSQSFGTFSDCYGTLLPNGHVLIMPVGPSSSGHTTIYNPTTNSWSQGPKLVHGGSADEQSWVKLADNSILTVAQGNLSERYIPATNTFVDDGALPVSLNDSLGEYGPGFLLPDGRALFVGASGHSAIYTPSGSTAPGTWVAGPDIPGGLGEDDAAGVQLRDGTILLTAGPIDSYNGPTTMEIYDPVANTIVPFTGPNSYTGAPFVTRMLALPNGDILYSENDSLLYQYDPGTAALPDAVPTISSVVPNADGSITLTGTNLNGLNVGASYGDDAQMDSNFPIISLTSGSNVYYARSYNWTNTGVMLGSTSESVTFTLPLNIPAGTYSLVTTANGVPSVPTTLTISTTSDNIAPTIAKVAAATPSPTTGTTAALSVQGADDAGESNLIYTWVNTKVPSGASLASFSVNGTNAAKNTTVTFHQAGSYTFVVTATDAGGLSVTSTVTVSVTATLSSVSISPTPVNLSTTQTRQLTATGRDQFGNSLTTQPTFTWAVASGGGTVSTTGLYTAPALGTLATVTATAGAFQSSVNIGVVKSPWTSADIGAPSIASIAYEAGNNTVVQGSGSDIWNAADQFHFDYQTLTGDTGITAQINSLPTLNTDGSQSFAAKAGVMFRDTTDKASPFVDLVYTNGIGLELLYRDTSGATAAQQGTTINVSGPIYVRLVRAGSVYTGSYSTNGTTWITVGSHTNTAIGASPLVGLVACSHDNAKVAKVTYKNVSFTYAQTLTSITLAPTPVNLSAGQLLQLSATARDQLGNPMTPQPTITWAVNSGNGTIAANGVYTAPATGTLATVTATAGAFQASSKIAVVNSPWTSNDIGGPSLPGIAYDNGPATIEQGSGTDIGSTADQFHFDYQLITGNSVIVAQITTLPTLNTDGTQTSAAKSGVMFRDSSSATSPFVDLVYTNGSGLQLIYRNGTALAAAQQGSSVNVTGSVYVKLARVGTAYTASYSTNGTTWTVIGTYVNAAIGINALVGLAVTSHSSTKLANVTFNHVAISQPTLATAAASAVSPVTTNTAALSVLGANLPHSAGEASLSYSWAVTALPAGAKTPVFSTNNSNAAKNTVATFFALGAYTFTATISDAYGQSVTSAVQVTVSQGLAAISPTATDGTLVAGESTQINAVDQFGNPFLSPVTWSATSGGMDNSGLFTAGQTGGSITITGVGAGITQTTSLNVIPTVYSGAAGSDTYAVRLSPTDASIEQIFVNAPEIGSPTYSIALTRLPSLTFSPAGSDGTLTLDYANGNPLPTGGVSYTGGQAPTPLGNLLYITGAAAGSLSFSVDGTHVTSGAASPTISYASLQGIEFDLLGGGNTLTQTAQPSAPIIFNAGDGANTLNVKAGAFTFNSGAVETGDLTVNVGTPSSPANVVFNESLRLAGLTVNDASHASVTGPSTLTLAGPLAILGTGGLDLGNGQLSLNSATTPLATLKPYLIAGYDGGLWDGTGGITSSFAASDASHTTGVGYADAADGIATGLPAGTILLKPALYGDANLDGRVDNADFTRLSFYYGQPGATWDQGDFNYDSAVDNKDFTQLSFNYSPPVTPPVVAQSSSMTISRAKTVVTAAPTAPTVQPATPAASTPFARLTPLPLVARHFSKPRNSKKVPGNTPFLARPE